MFSQILNCKDLRRRLVCHPQLPMERTCEEAVEHLFDLHALDATAS
jgi:hypothetical protein